MFSKDLLLVTEESIYFVQPSTYQGSRYMVSKVDRKYGDRSTVALGSLSQMVKFLELKKANEATPVGV